MSRERTNVAGIIVVTVCITSVVLAGAWFAAVRYLPQQTVTEAHQEAAAAPATPRKSPKARKTGAVTGAAVGEVSKQAEPVAASPSESAAAHAPEPADAAPARGAEAAAVTSAADTTPEHTEAAAPKTSDAAAPAAAESHMDARTIMEEAQRRAEANFYRYDGLLQSFDAKNKVTEKRWTFDRKGSHGQSKALVRFTAPAEVKGVALLIVNHPERASDQWMWTPAIERDRRIAMQDRSTRFFGTDFSFEDLEEHDVDQYDYSMLGSEPIDGASCWKIQSTPKKTRASQYTKSIVWVRKDNYLPVRLDNYVKGDVLRRLTYSNLENIQGIWTARLLEMADLNRGTRTRLTLQEVKYNAPVKDEAFTIEAIRR